MGKEKGLQCIVENGIFLSSSTGGSDGEKGVDGLGVTETRGLWGTSGVRK